MLVMRENADGVWGHFKKAWPHHCERLEPAFDSGLPDVLVKDIRGAAGLAELKAPDKLELRPSQKVWIRRWQDQGSCAIPVVTCDNIEGRIQWKVMRFFRGSKGNTSHQLQSALKKDEGRWIRKEEMIHLVCLMNGLEPYLE
jgi:hypothetical protein